MITARAREVHSRRISKTLVRKLKRPTTAPLMAPNAIIVSGTWK
jgi:hypothetical protein